VRAVSANVAQPALRTCARQLTKRFFWYILYADKPYKLT
jgi:hypothetical protein